MRISHLSSTSPTFVTALSVTALSAFSTTTISVPPSSVYVFSDTVNDTGVESSTYPSGALVSTGYSYKKLSVYTQPFHGCEAVKVCTPADVIVLNDTFRPFSSYSSKVAPTTFTVLPVSASFYHLKIKFYRVFSKNLMVIWHYYH